jgi:purine-binding chemotaxis protein CheW
MVGFIVDTVLETKQVPVHSLEASPTIVMGGIESEYITSIAKLEERLVILLSIEKILALESKEELPAE